VRILHTVQRYAPETGGSEEVVKQLSERLAARGHDVTVATSVSPRRRSGGLNGVSIAGFACRGNSVEGLSGDTRAYREFVRRGTWDVMMNYAAQIWSTDLVLDLLPALPARKVLVPCGYSRLHDPRYRDYFAELPGILRQYDRVVYLSDSYIDGRFGAGHGLTNGVVIPNGADPEEFASARPGAFRQRHGIGDRVLILNVSNHSRLKGHAFFWECLRSLRGRPVAAALIGNPYAGWPKKWASECYRDCRVQGWRLGVPVLEGRPRREVIEAFADADVFLFGSQVECSPLVMFEAFASRTLFVTTECGNVRDHDAVARVVGSVKEAVGVIGAYCDAREGFADRLARGEAAVRDRLNWDAITDAYEALYRSLPR
jgi:glycosyltransferase involved in cell wall biosynthesis